MVLLIDHRVNTLEELERVPADHGVEIDVRDYDGELVLAHDPFERGIDLATYLRSYRHALLIFNVKCDGLEDRISQLAEQHGVGEYFFLDVANPTLVRLVTHGESAVAVRYSEHEPIEFALAFAGRARWVWVDCFSHLPLDGDSYRRLREHFRICVVSPELQGHPRSVIRDYRRQLEDLPVDAVCTDFPGDWSEAAR